MILDKIENIDLYLGVNDRIRKALLLIKESRFEEMKDGRYEIEGEVMYMTISRYQTKPIEDGKWESHKKYIDVQFIAEGAESVGYSNITNMTIVNEYNEEKDIRFLKGYGNFFTAEKSTFFILFPEDVHMPGISLESNKPQLVTKVVVKVKAD